MSKKHSGCYVGIFFVSLVSIAFEISLTRYFAVSNWSEYGYWIISMAMVGFSLSGVVICLFKDFFLKRSQGFFFAIPMAMMVTAAAGFAVINTIPFNPLELQNSLLWRGQLANIGKYYVALFPFFFSAGLYVGLSFTARCDRIPSLYLADLVGAGLGALYLLGAMSYVHPFYLPAALLPLLWFAVPRAIPSSLETRRAATLVATLVLLALCEAWLIFGNTAVVCEYKPVATAMNVTDNKVLFERRSPRGLYQLLDNYTERLDLDLSSNYDLLGAGGPPSSLGLYRDGERVAALPKLSAKGALDFDSTYMFAALDALPYRLRPAPKTLLVGTRGGFRLREALEIGAPSVAALETDPVVRELVAERITALAAAAKADPKRISLGRLSPHAFLASGTEKFDCIDVASDYLDQGQANKYAFTVEGIQELYAGLSDRGVISLPIAITEFTVYAVKVVNTARAALAGLGVKNPGDRIIVYRSPWSARVLIARTPFTAEDIAALRAFCSERSFDASYYPGIDPAKAEIFNDLPPLSFESDTPGVRSDVLQDALMNDVNDLLAQGQTNSSVWTFFNLKPSTFDRPFFYNILRPLNLPDILRKIDIIPRPEISYLINLAVLFQAVAFAVIVLLLPLLKGRRLGVGAGDAGRGIVYFMCLGLGFLCMEIALIERFAFFLNDSASAFAIVLTVMLIFSGLGSGFSGRGLARPRQAVYKATAWIVALIVVLALGLTPLLSLATSWSEPLKLVFIAACVAPLAFVLGMPFPLGLSFFQGERSAFLPWAWSINGAFSVIATPLANLMAVSMGYSTVFYLSAALYLLAAAFVPRPGAAVASVCPGNA